MQQQRHQQMLARLPRRVRASILLADSAANLASTFNAKYLPMHRVDRYFYGWTQQLLAYQAPPAWVITHATTDALTLQEQAKVSVRGGLAVRSGRRKQYASRRQAQPNITVLRTTNKEVVEQWRAQLTIFIRQVQQLRRNIRTQHTIKLAKWVARPVWLQISQRLLKPDQRTRKGEPTNDRAVTRYLLGLQEPTAASPRQPLQTRPTARTPNNQVRSIIQAAIRDSIISINGQSAPIQAPAMRVLATARPDDIASWQRDLQMLMADSREYRRRYDPNYRISVRDWVQPAIWAHISEHMVAPDQRTAEGAPPNDAAVEAYLVRQPGPPRKSTTSGFSDTSATTTHQGYAA